MTIHKSFTPTAALKEKCDEPTDSPYCSKYGASQVSKALSCLCIPQKKAMVTTTVGTTLPANVSQLFLPSKISKPTTTLVAGNNLDRYSRHPSIDHHIDHHNISGSLDGPSFQTSALSVKSNAVSSCGNDCIRGLLPAAHYL